MGTGLCQRCNKAQAAVHVLDILPPEGEKRERHLCERCAVEEGLAAQKHEPINVMMEGLIKHAAGVSPAADSTCPQCGLTFREFRGQGLLGCPNDYAAFDKQLSALIERAHEGATHHVGKTPARLQGELPASAKAAVLRREMKEALGVEDYELAARLRDQLRALESA